MSRRLRLDVSTPGTGAHTTRLQHVLSVGYKQSGSPSVPKPQVQPSDEIGSWGDSLSWAQVVNQSIVGRNAMPAFRNFISKLMQADGRKFEEAYKDYYYVPDAFGESYEPYPIAESIDMIRKLMHRSPEELSASMFDTSKDFSKVQVWKPVDVLALLSNRDTWIGLISYGRSGVVYKFYHPSLGEKAWVLKHSVRVPATVKDYLKVSNESQAFQAQREKISDGSLEQYLQSMAWLDPEHEARSYVATIWPVDNTLLSEPCTFVIMEHLEGLNFYTVFPLHTVSPVKEDVKASIKEEIIYADNLLESVGIRHNDLLDKDKKDLKDGGNVLIQFLDQTKARIKIIDFGEATPVAGLTLRALLGNHEHFRFAPAGEGRTSLI